MTRITTIAPESIARLVSRLNALEREVAALRGEQAASAQAPIRGPNWQIGAVEGDIDAPALFKTETGKSAIVRYKSDGDSLENTTIQQDVRSPIQYPHLDGELCEMRRDGSGQMWVYPFPTYLRRIQTLELITEGGSGDAAVLDDDNDPTGLEITVKDFMLLAGEDIASGKRGVAGLFGDVWWLISIQCP